MERLPAGVMGNTPKVVNVPVRVTKDEQMIGRLARVLTVRRGSRPSAKVSDARLATAVRG